MEGEKGEREGRGKGEGKESDGEGRILEVVDVQHIVKKYRKF